MKAAHLILSILIGATASVAGAQPVEFPTRAVHIIVPFSAGGGADLLARTLGAKLTQTWGQPVVVENKPGAGSNIAAEYVAKSTADGYTLLLASTANSINHSLYPQLNYDMRRDFLPVVLIGETSQILITNHRLAVSDVDGLIRLLKSNPDKYSYSSSGNGSQPHLAAELFKHMTGTSMTHVPYKGAAPAMNDLLADHVQISFGTAPAVMGHIKSGSVKALGVSGKNRIAQLPDVPTLHEAGVPGYEASGYIGLVVPAATPADVVEKLYRDTSAILDGESVKRTLSDAGFEIRTAPSEDYRRLIDDEIRKWAAVVDASGARID
ncbi:tripartite tricarboxylate transporter substrate binding protein [Verticiella sediminum]|uniref:Tripartite tricarboxylate transporter substrate binding protein n=1 Tax=Verticiella sediminum TaxID=1247510 RepID=A0A556B228_9BURK|nr:tripartite tricarboxylate transporter substrate binding protein [Verticiella sediminum]TSH99247.1 tripartite tricarboxylate transporter substrate binding protein [Verticiella sediminum]